MRKATIRQRLQYWFDALMSRGTAAMLVGLFAVATAIVLTVAALVSLTRSAPEGRGFFELAWMGLVRTLDPGTMGGDAGNSFFRFMMLVVTIGGIFVVSALIGILNTGLEVRLGRLRKGRSRVLENNHTLILGWNPQIFNIISELVIANESLKGRAAVVVLAERDKVEMEDSIRERLPNPKNTRIICRSGSPVDLTDLEIASPQTARSIIVLPEGTEPDVRAIKSVLAITNNPNRREDPYRIVTQIADAKNLDVVTMLGARDAVMKILSKDLIARIVAQTSRQSGLSIVYTELMNFDGDEIYFTDEAALHGKTFGETLGAYERCAVMGLRKVDGTIALNPPMESRVETGDRLIALAQDDDKFICAVEVPDRVDEASIQARPTGATAKPEKALLLGWNECGTTIIRELDNYVAPGSQVTVVTDVPGAEEQIRAETDGLVNQTVGVRRGDIRHRDLLESIGPRDYDHVMVLSYRHLDPQQADAITLVTLLHLRDIAERDETPFSIVSEMLDLRNRELAEATRVDDFIVSEHLMGLMMAQLSENAELAAVFTDIFDADGSEIYLKPIGDYVVTGRPVDFYTVTEAARRRGEVALGYRVAAESRDAATAYGVYTNPRKSASVCFNSEDKIIVLAEA